MIRPGSKVRYRFTHRMIGTVVRRHGGKLGGWIVHWENGQFLQAAEENLEQIPATSNSSAPKFPKLPPNVEPNKK